MSPIHYPAITRLQKYCCHYIPWHERETLIEKIVNNVRCIPSKTNYSKYIFFSDGLGALLHFNIVMVIMYRWKWNLFQFLFIMVSIILKVNALSYSDKIQTRNFFAYICVIHYQSFSNRDPFYKLKIGLHFLADFYLNKAICCTLNFSVEYVQVNYTNINDTAIWMFYIMCHAMWKAWTKKGSKYAN